MIASKWIHPSAAIAAGLDIFIIPENIITRVGLQVLVAGYGTPGFGAGIYAIEIFWFFFQIKSQSLKMFIPVWILDNDFHFGIYFFCRPHNEFFTGIRH